MGAELLALGAALGFASSKVAVKFATQTGGMVLGFLITLAASIIAVTIVAVATVETWAVPLDAAMLFALAGLIGPGAGRILGMRAVRDAGASVAVPVQSSVNPLLSSSAGVVFFGEAMGVGKAVALLLIIGGIWACVRGGSANRAPLVPGHDRDGFGTLAVLLVPMFAGAAYGTMDIVQKFALGRYGDPVLAALIGLTAAFVMWLAIFLATPRFREPLRLTPSLGWFALSGILSAAAQISLLFALLVGNLSVVAPIAASQPAIVIILGAVVLRQLEKLRVGTVVGAAVVFLGVAYLTVG